MGGGAKSFVLSHALGLALTRTSYVCWHYAVSHMQAHQLLVSLSSLRPLQCRSASSLRDIRSRSARLCVCDNIINDISRASPP
eukprot:5626151-Amphidinium_carterae.1